MIKQTLTFGGIIIATLTVLTLAGVTFPAAGNLFTAQLINSVEEGSSKKDDGGKESEIKEEEPVKDSEVKEGEIIPIKEPAIKEDGGEKEVPQEEEIKELEVTVEEEIFSIKESEVKENPVKEGGIKGEETFVKESGVKEEEILPIKESEVKENPVKEGSVRESVLVKSSTGRKESQPVTLAFLKAADSESLKSSESTPKKADEELLEVAQKVEIPLLPTQEPKPIIENDYRVSDATSNETKEILEEVKALVCFEEYIKPGASDNNRSEVRRWQDFLNTYMKSDLEVTGNYDSETQEVVKAFQQKHYDYIIAPWTPPLSPRTTGYIYKTTRSMANYIIGCPEPEVFLEDAGVWYSHLEQEITFQ